MCFSHLSDLCEYFEQKTQRFIGLMTSKAGEFQIKGQTVNKNM